MVVESPVLNTQVDDPSHPLHHHRRIVTDFEYGDILGEGSYSTVCVCVYHNHYLVLILCRYLLVRIKRQKSCTQSKSWIKHILSRTTRSSM